MIALRGFWPARRILILVIMLLFSLHLPALWSCERVEDPIQINPLDPDNPQTGGNPFRLSAVVGPSAIDLTWQAVTTPGIFSYRILKHEGLMGNFEPLLPDISASVHLFTDSEISAGRTYSYKVVALDTEGRQSDESNQVAVAVHSLATFTINNGADSTITRNVYLHVRAADCDSLWVWNGATIDSASGQWLTKDEDLGLLAWELCSGSGLKTVMACLHYSTGQRRMVNATIATAPPSAPSVAINGGAEFSASQEVVLTLWAGGAVSVMIANTVDYIGAIWENYMAVYDWQLTVGDGVKWVYVKFRNDFGLETTSSSAITLDMTPPNLSNVWGAPADSTDLVRLPVEVSWGGAIDDGSGIQYYRVYLDANPSPMTEVFSGLSTNYVVSSLYDFTKYYWRIVVFDKAGNMSNGPVWYFYNPSSSFVYIPPGTFMMGSPLGELGRVANETQHQVTLTRGFYISKYEVTRQWWNEVMNLTPTTLQLAVNGLYWDRVVQFCNRLSIRHGLDSAYYIYGSDGDVEWDQDANGYRLPTEAEWEYACRAGAETPFANGPITHIDCEPLDEVLDEIGWYCGNSPEGTQVVGLKEANAWGLYDMHGNVCELVWDSYRSDYQNLNPVNPAWGIPSTWRVYRGGFSYYYYASSCRSASRFSIEPDMEVGGFRPVRTAF